MVRGTARWANSGRAQKGAETAGSTHRLVLEVVGSEPGGEVLGRVILKAPLEELELILQEPAAQVLGAAIGQAQDEVRDLVLAQARMIGGHVHVASLADHFIELLTLETLGAVGLNGAEHCEWHAWHACEVESAATVSA